VIGLSLAPSLAALVPVVPRDAHCLALAGKSSDSFVIKSRSTLQSVFMQVYIFIFGLV
jgi:hypothetical protein